MIIGIGNDLVDIRRIEGSISRFGERFLNRVFTAVERKRSEGRRDRASSYAKRFAAKEAMSKALGTGFQDGVFMRDIGVVNLASGRPTLELTGGALEKLRTLVPPGFIARIDLTMTDEYPMAQAFVIISAVHALIALQGPIDFPLFYTLVILAFFCIGFQGPNYNAIAMEPLGALAGSGAALIGFASSFVSASLGGLIARQFDGTVTPIFIGHFILGAAALLTIFITEKGKLMQSHGPSGH